MSKMVPSIDLPLISIITVVFNGIKYIESTIESIINQAYPNIEYIIIDGGSKDGTIDIIKKYENSIVKWISEPDKGTYDAMNKGIMLAKGMWINFMNCGDKFFSNTVVSEIFSEKDNLNYELIYGNIEYRYDSFVVIERAKPNLEDFWKGMVFSHQSTFTKTDLYRRYNFDLSYKFAADFDFFLKIVESSVRYKYIDNIVSSNIVEGLTRENIGKSLKDRIRIISQKKILRFNLYYLKRFLIFSLKESFKKIIPIKILPKATLIKNSFFSSSREVIK